MLLIFDASVSEKKEIEMIKKVRKALPDIKVLALTSCGESGYPQKNAETEINGYLLKETEPAEFKRIISSILYEENNESESQKHLKLTTEGDKIKLLTNREREVLIHTAEGKLNKEIADALNISERTVKNHLSSIFRKLEVSDRTQAAVLAVRSISDM